MSEAEAKAVMEIANAAKIIAWMQARKHGIDAAGSYANELWESFLPLARTAVEEIEKARHDPLRSYR